MGAETIDEIIEWMRGRSEDGRADRALWARAADAVECAVAELRAECERLRMVAEERSRMLDKQFAERDRLRAALAEIGEMNDGPGGSPPLSYVFRDIVRGALGAEEKGTKA